MSRFSVASELLATLGPWYQEPGWWSVGAAVLLGAYTWWSTERAREEARSAAEKQKQFRRSQDSLNRRFQSTQNEIQRRFHSTRDRISRINRDRGKFLRSFNSFVSVPGVTDTGDETTRVQDVSRFFREKVRHYSACRNVFEEIKSDLTDGDRRELEELSGEVARYFTSNFDIDDVKELVRRQKEFLGAAKRVMDDRLEDLRAELEDPADGSPDELGAGVAEATTGFVARPAAPEEEERSDRGRAASPG